MEFKRIKIKALVYLILLLAAAFLTFYFIWVSDYWLVSIWTGLLVIVFSILLLRLVQKSESSLKNFLQEIHHGEFKNKYLSISPHDDLTIAFEQIMEVYRNLRIEKEANYQYLNTVVEHVNIALLCFDKNEKIVLSNQAAQLLFNRSILTDLSVIEKINIELAILCRSLKSGQKSLLKYESNGIPHNLSVQAIDFKLKEIDYKLISFQDIKAELEEQELDSWKKLVRVLTHEIMNTAIPISTLASVINQMFVDENGNDKMLKDFIKEEQDDIRHSLQTIEKRSKGIVDFVKATKSYTSIPEPQFEEIYLDKLIDNVISLHKPEIENRKIKLYVDFPKRASITQADPKLIEQVIINILRNAMDALYKIQEPGIDIKITRSLSGKTQVQFSDNGCGMNSETLENIFVPFYTTKKDGSGIGLSLSKKIMHLHNGSIYVSSDLGIGTTINIVC